MKKKDPISLFSSMTHLVDKSSPVPLYFQISEAMFDGIKKVQLDPSTRIPPEDQLARIFGVSKMTMRQALGKLVSDGVLIRRKGSGTFISEKKIEREATRLIGFYEDIKKKGLKPSSRVIEKKVVKAETKLMEKLRLEKGDPIIKIIRVRLANEIPLAVNYAYIPEKRCMGLLEEELSQDSLSAIVEQKYQLCRGVCCPKPAGRQGHRLRSLFAPNHSGRSHSCHGTYHVRREPLAPVPFCEFLQGGQVRLHFRIIPLSREGKPDSLPRQTS